MRLAGIPVSAVGGAGNKLIFPQSLQPLGSQPSQHSSKPLAIRPGLPKQSICAHATLTCTLPTGVGTL